MKRENKIFTLFFIGLFLISLFVTVVSAATLLDDIKNALSGSFSDDTKGAISKVLLMILVMFIVYSISDSLPFMSSNEVVKWVISGLIAVLSFIFVSSDNIKFILYNYEALGIVLTSVLPLIIIMVFTVKLREKNASYAVFINKLIIIGFAAYIGIKWLSFDSTKYTAGIPELVYVYPITLIGALIWLAIEKKVWKWFRKAKLEGEEESASNTIAKAVLGAKELEAAHKGLSQKKRIINPRTNRPFGE